jgi:regulator of replication initiation timing
MISIIVEKIVTDRRQHEASDDFSSTFGIAVGTVVQSLSDLDRLKSVDRQLSTIKEQYEKTVNEKNELQNEVQKLRILPSQLEHETLIQRNTQLKKENDSLRDVLKTSKETIAMLSNRIQLNSVEGKRGSIKRKSMDVRMLPSRKQWVEDTYGHFSFGSLFRPFFGKRKRPVSASPMIPSKF